MPTEIERKFLVTGSDWRTADPLRICQGYLNRDKHRTVRVRISGDAAFLTIKGVSRGATRAEFEYPIPRQDAEAMLLICDGALVEKLRHRVPYAGLTWEVDEFLGENRGLVVAEIEIESEAQSFVSPPWLGQEVTSDSRYFNSSLAVNPFSRW